MSVWLYVRGDYAWWCAGCEAGYGWSLSSGVGCCKHGSITQPAELESCKQVRQRPFSVPFSAEEKIDHLPRHARDGKWGA